MSLTLYFLRHGETTYSETGAYCGEVDAELTVVKFDLHGPLLQELGNRAYMSEELRTRPGT